ncbi:MAG: hypothetical protein ACXAC7_16160 [Candidatus Hodarchaeales archaeon]
MISLNKEIEDLVLSLGALKVGFANRETMSGGPPSADITYHISNAQSAVVFALPLNKNKIDEYLRKTVPNGRVNHDKDNMETTLKAYSVANTVTNLLIEKGYEAVPIFPNFKYRDNSLKGRIYSKPEISLRYLAVRSGVGSFGWSGNVGIKNFGTAFLLGGLTTTAKLEPTNPIPTDESFCSKCKLCEKVCAFRMFDRNKEISITLGGVKFSYAKRIDIVRCVIICGGYSGLNKDGTFSTWAPARYSYPETREEIIDTFSQAVRVKLDLKVRNEIGGFDSSFIDGNKETKEFLLKNHQTLKLLKSIKFTCGFCQLICSGNSKKTLENYQILTNSGFVIRNKDGTTSVLRSDEGSQANLLNHSQRRNVKDRITSKLIEKILMSNNEYIS